jgi:hypothetical protein
MEKSQTDFVQECLAEIAALKALIAALEEKLDAYQAQESQAVEPVMEETTEDSPVDFTDVDLSEDVSAGADDSSVANFNLDNDFADEIAAVSDSSAFSAEKEETVAPAASNDVDETAGLPWRKDKPGLRVKNIRSGISLYDRALFIGTLFKEDFSLYEDTIRDLNELVSLDQAVDYIRTHFPQWNLHSDVVYNFMMSIRKKLG